MNRRHTISALVLVGVLIGGVMTAQSASAAGNCASGSSGGAKIKMCVSYANSGKNWRIKSIQVTASKKVGAYFYAAPYEKSASGTAISYRPGNWTIKDSTDLAAEIGPGSCTLSFSANDQGKVRITGSAGAGSCL